MIFLCADDDEFAGQWPQEEDLTPLQGELLWQLARSPGKKSFKSLAIKTVISSFIFLLFNAGLTFVMPEGARGAGGRYLGQVYQTITLKMQGHNSLSKAPEGEVADRFEKAVAIAPFALKFPTYLPSQVTLSEVIYFDSDNFELYCIFYNLERSFVLSQRNSATSVMALALDFNEERAREVYTHSFKGLFSSKEDDNNFYSFVDDRNIHFFIYGQIEEAEIIKIAHSLQARVN